MNSMRLAAGLASLVVCVGTGCSSSSPAPELQELACEYSVLASESVPRAVTAPPARSPAQAPAAISRLDHPDLIPLPTRAEAGPGNVAGESDEADEKRNAVEAEDREPFADDKWHFRVVGYGWLPAIKVRAAGSDVNIYQSDILDDLSFAFMATADVRRNRLGFFVENLIVDLEKDDHVGFRGRTDAKIDLTQGFVQACPYYRVCGDESLSVDVIGGVRFFYTKIKLKAGALDTTVRESWWEPVIGPRAFLRLTERWGLFVRGDVGGFSIGEAPRLSWQAMGMVRWSLSESVALFGGYRYYYTHYHHGSDFKEKIGGPLVGASFSF